MRQRENTYFHKIQASFLSPDYYLSSFEQLKLSWKVYGFQKI